MLVTLAPISRASVSATRWIAATIVERKRPDGIVMIIAELPSNLHVIHLPHAQKEPCSVSWKKQYPGEVLHCFVMLNALD